MRTYRGVVLLLLVGVITGGVFAGFQNHKHSKQHVYIHLPAGIKASIYKDQGGDGAYNYDQSQPPIVNVPKGGGWVNLKRQAYDVVINDPGNQYEDAVTKVYVDYSTKDVAISPSYSDSALAELLPENRGAALAALYAKYPLMQTNYSVGKDGLYGLADWYGVVLKPNAPQMDTVRVILHWQDGEWEVATTPLISIGAPAHSKIPYSVIDSVDKL